MKKGLCFWILLTFVVLSNSIVFAQTSSINDVATFDSNNCLGYKSSDDSSDSSQRVCLSISNNMIARSYFLGPKDVISISVYDSPEFDQDKVMVQPDGKISITPLGSINVAGMTTEELQKILVQKLKFYLNTPIVTVKLLKTRPFIVYVSGAVMKAGSYEINTDTTQEFITSEIVLERKTPLLSNILVAAGGITYDADLENVIISNDFDNTRVKVNLLELIENGDSKQDIYLVAGDRVNIPKLPTAFAVDEQKYQKYMSSTISPDKVPVKVLGFVNSPGLIMLDTKQSLTLNSAISAAGGYYNDARYPPDKVYLSRVDGNGHMATKVVNPKVSDVVLMPKDIVYIPEKSRPMIGKFFDYATRLITPINAVASSYNNWALMFNPDRYSVQVTK
ncbi:MAG: polysaccharide biosynthesis/export family protein [Vampirovibrionia bacterium]